MVVWKPFDKAHYGIEPNFRLQLCIGKEEIRKSSLKWNVSNFKGESANELRKIWASLPEDASFFFKIRYIRRFSRQHSKQHAKAFGEKILNARYTIFGNWEVLS